MTRVTLTLQAKQDLSSTYIGEGNLSAADHTLDAINEKIGLLADNSQLGTARPDIAPDLRYLVSENSP